MPELLYAREIAERLEVKPATIYEWERLGKIPSIRTGRRVVFNLTSVVQALRSTQASRPNPAAN